MKKRISTKLIFSIMAFYFIPVLADAQDASELYKFKGNTNRDGIIHTILDQSMQGNTELWQKISDTLYSKGQNATRTALDNLSGVFLAQTIVGTARDNTSNALYNRLQAGGGQNSSFANSVWLKVETSEFEMNNSDNNVGNNVNEAKDFLAGGLMAVNDNYSAGLFVHGNNENIKQGPNRAFISTLGMGFYGGLFNDGCGLSAHISISQHSVNATRKTYMDGEYASQSNFDLFSVKGGLEGGIPLLGQEASGINLTGVAGANMAIVSNDDINENGGGIADLTVKANSYRQLVGYTGLKIGGSGPATRWHIQAAVDYLAYGNDVDSRYIVNFNLPDISNANMRVRALEINPFSFSLSGGIEFMLGERFSVYASAKRIAGQDISLTSLGLGVNIAVGNGPKTNEIGRSRENAISRNETSDFKPYTNQKPRTLERQNTSAVRQNSEQERYVATIEDKQVNIVPYQSNEKTVPAQVYTPDDQASSRQSTVRKTQKRPRYDAKTRSIARQLKPKRLIITKTKE